MFSELPKLLERDFAIGYFLPVAAFVAVSIGIAHTLGLVASLVVSQTDLLIGTTLIGLATWLAGVCLLAANWEILRLMEGYGRFNPARLTANLEKRRFRKLRDEIARVETEWKSLNSSNKPVPADLQTKRARLKRQVVAEFPPDESQLMPTAFGNAIRAFEMYPYVMYGLDPIPGWGRLLGVIPKEYGALVDAAKTHMDFWVNLGLLSWIVAAEYTVIALATSQSPALWIPIAALIVAWIASYRAKRSAVGWGAMVIAAFDLYLPALRRTLGFGPFTSKEQERQVWTDFSQAIIYRLPSKMPQRHTLSSATDEEELPPSVATEPE